MNINDLIQQTADDISLYRYPATNEFKAAINPILEAAGLGRDRLLDSDRIDSLDTDNDELGIDYSWSRMSCEQSGDIRIPMSIVTAPDPIYAANVWRLDNKLRAAHAAYDQALVNTLQATKVLEQVDDEVNKFYGYKE